MCGKTVCTRLSTYSCASWNSSLETEPQTISILHAVLLLKAVLSNGLIWEHSYQKAHFLTGRNLLPPSSLCCGWQQNKYNLYRKHHPLFFLLNHVFKVSIQEWQWMDHSFVVNDKYNADFGTDSLILFSWWLNGKNDAWLTSTMALG